MHYDYNALDSCQQNRHILGTIPGALPCSWAPCAKSGPGHGRRYSCTRRWPLGLGVPDLLHQSSEKRHLQSISWVCYEGEKCPPASPKELVKLVR